MKRLLTSLALTSLATFGMAQSEASRTLIYGEEVKLDKPINLADTTQRPLTQVLDEALAGTGIEYRITSRHILLFRRPQKQALRTFTIGGFVTDALSRETLIGANIYCPALRTGTVSNEFGHYSLTLPEGRHTIIVSYVGYDSELRTISVGADLTADIALGPNHALKEVTVDSDRPETGVASTRLGANSISMRQIERTPAMLGEPDVIKALQNIAGVQTGTKATTQMSVRGGNIDQNLYLLDGVMLYNADHVLGFESAFMPDAVKHVDFYRGSFPARYGGRLSSVVDVRTKDGDMQHYHGLFSIGLLTSHFNFEGPIVKDKTSFMIAARRTYVGYILNLMEQLSSDPEDDLKTDIYFYDINAKLNHKFDDRNRLYFSFYRGRDGMKVKDQWKGQESDDRSFYSTCYENDRNEWGNTLYNLRWNHVFSPSLFTNMSVGFNSFCMSTHNETRDEDKKRENGKDTMLEYTWMKTKLESKIDDMTASYDIDYHHNASHHMKMGMSYTLHRFRPDCVESESELFDGEKTSASQGSSHGQRIIAHQTGIYGEDDMTLGEKFQLNLGLRAELMNVKGKCYPAIEPRLAAAYRLPSDLRLKAGYSRMHQYVHQLTTSVFVMPDDMWVPITRQLPPMSADLWSVGVGHQLQHGIEITAELYWKEMHNVLEFKDGTGFYNNVRAWETMVEKGRGRSYGLELMATRNVGKTTGSVAYTLSKTTRHFPGCNVNNGRPYPYRFDRRHKLNANIQHDFSERFDIGASWTFASGGYMTVAHQNTVISRPGSIQPFTMDYFASRNNYKLAPSHQLDLSVNLHRRKRHGFRTWNFSVINAYAHRNQDIIFSSRDEDTGKRVIKMTTIIRFLPSASYIYKF